MIVAYVNPEKLWELKKSLFELGVPGMSVDNFMGIGKPMRHFKELMDKHGAVPKFFPKARVEIVCEDALVEEVLSTIRKCCCTDHPGDGKVFVLPVEDALRIRTGERGEEALR